MIGKDDAVNNSTSEFLDFLEVRGLYVVNAIKKNMYHRNLEYNSTIWHIFFNLTNTYLIFISHICRSTDQCFKPTHIKTEVGNFIISFKIPRVAINY